MLGLAKGKPKWQWAVSGKHPLAADYFRSGAGDPIYSAFAVWMDDGFAALPNTPEARHAICFWRFWVRGAKRGNLLCGLLKASSDRIGRPYPLLIIGGGSLNGWEKNWVYLPAVLETIWQQIEYIASKRFISLEELAAAIHKIEAPTPEMFKTIRNREFEADHGASVNLSDNSSDIINIAEHLKTQKAVMVPLDEQSRADPSYLPVLWSLQLQMQGMDLPQAIFIGGPPEQQFLMVLTRSLKVMDFVNLWSM